MCKYANGQIKIQSSSIKYNVLNYRYLIKKNNEMTKGLGRFEFYLIQLDDLLLKAAQSKNPALFLYQNDGRTIIFMLEGLAKLYAGMHNEKQFLKIKERVKLLEDLLGGIDHYDNFAKDFLKDAKIPATVTKFCEKKRDEKLAELNAALLKRKWINHDPLRTKKIRKRLARMDWQTSEKEIELIKEFYLKSIIGINNFYKEAGPAFTNLEEQVHEIRRKLRWLSIYPRALQGAIQLKDNKTKDKAVAKYLIPEIINSPFNKMPAKGTNNPILFLEKNYFLALSNILSTLGTLKDSGLRIHALADAIKETQTVSEEIALQQAYKLTKMKPDGLKEIMVKAYDICKLYFEEKNLEKLVSS